MLLCVCVCVAIGLVLRSSMSDPHFFVWSQFLFVLHQYYLFDSNLFWLTIDFIVLIILIEIFMLVMDRQQAFCHC